MPERTLMNDTKKSASLESLPLRAGIGLKTIHYPDVLAQINGPTQIGFVEVHAENYMAAGGPSHHYLSEIRANLALSIHGVGLSIGAHGPLDEAHIERLVQICKRYQPQSFSEHLAWSTHGGRFLNDLLPVPYDDEALAQVSDHVDQLQNALGRRILLENPSTYIAFESSALSEIDFLSEVARRSGCGLLLDVNNVYVSANNHAFDPAAYIDAFPMESVGQIHLAGFSIDDSPGPRLLIDAHGSAVDAAVWPLYRRALARSGPLPTLIEWDNDVPAYAVLMAEAAIADGFLSAANGQERRVRVG